MKEKVLKNIEMLIFDMDGVITEEEIYWYDTGLTVYEIVEEKMLKGDTFKTHNFEFLVKKSEEYLQRDFISEMKSRGLTSNWDIAYVLCCLYVIGALKLICEKGRNRLLATLIKAEEKESFLEYLEAFGKEIEFKELRENTKSLIRLFLDNIKNLHGRGFKVIDYLNTFLEELTGIKVRKHLFQKCDKFWLLCQQTFQEWHLGDELYEKNYGMPLKRGKQGMIYHEEALLPIEDIKSTLQTLRASGIRLGIATGRPYGEAFEFLKIERLFDFFHKEHIVTYREVENAEKVLLKKGIRTALSKPNPFSLLKAIYPNVDVLKIYNGEYPKKHENIAIVTDATGDILAAKEIGCVTIGVLSGIETETALENAGCDAIITDMTYLPVLFNLSNK